MRFRTVCRYLIGDRQAILELAASPWTLAVGALFVLSAGLAREYDGEDLLHEPWHLLIPFGASLLASFLLFRIADFDVECGPDVGLRFWRGYARFLGLFWMTAPLALLYAVPYERFLGPADAVRANLATLGLVSAWRVALMVRVFVVTLGFRPLQAFCVVTAFGSVAVFLATAFLQVQLVGIMGGIRQLSDADAALNQIGGWLCCLSALAAPALTIGAILCGPKVRNSQVTTDQTARRPTGPIWMAALGAVGIWALVLPWTQPEQQLRREVEITFQEGRFGDALALMSAHDPEDFPPHWEPPPRRLTPWSGQPLFGVWDAILAQPPAPWVREAYLKKLQDWLKESYLSLEDTERLAQILTKIPEGRDIMNALEAQEHYRLDELRSRYRHFSKQRQKGPSNAQEKDKGEEKDR
jgi:hypothetical protein